MNLFQPPQHPPCESVHSSKKARASQWLHCLTAGITLAWGCSIAPAALAAERLAVRFGPVQQAVSIADLEQFAETGEIPPALRLYAPFLTPNVQQALNSHLRLDPQVGDELVTDLLNSSAGERLLDTLQLVIAESDVTQLNSALIAAAQQPNGLSVLGFLRAYPTETVTVDGNSAIALASQMNLPYWQSQALSSVLERELTVPPTQPAPNANLEATQTYISGSQLDPSIPGNQWVRQQTLMFRDYSRSRTIPVDLYWSRRTTGPLVVLSHGFGADRRFLEYLAHHLASHGFAVAAIEHPASNVTWLTEITANRPSADILPASEFIDRPRDVTFLLNELERLNRHSTILRGKLNTNQVVVLGHSLGGYTALTLAGAELDLDQLRQFCSHLGAVGLSPADWLQCTAADLSETGRINLRDRRVVQVIALNPVIGHLLNQQSLARLTTPTLILSGTDDAITPAVSQQLLPFAQLQAPKYLLTAIGGTHLSVGDPDNLNYALTNSLFVRERPGEETEALRQLLRAVSLSFIKQLTPEARQYKPFLTSAYAQSFSTSTLQLRLNSELPPNLSNWLKMAALPLEQLVSSSLQKRANAELQAKNRDSGIYELLKRLPIVMFILPGNFSRIGNQLVKFNRRRKI